ncbi:response regulator transcription factor [Alkalibacterium kapii]|uniref:DNA-binding response regulator n=1 Tax=Alkalibacterium kapii TaxID=426704 RepID=A0A511ARA6_9LACT|nr:response regulator transcription factor [Alkalibacterium kapii]GEK90740.1 DNA-binding response regulator [Alkalibacterium kapii]
MLNLNASEMSKKRILLVDDEEDILNLLETVLIKEGFQNIHKVTNGIAAIEIAQSIEPDIIVLDIMLPDMDGYEVCKQLREFTYSPIIFLSAKSDDVDKLLGLGVGGDDYVTKPFSPKEVAYRIKAQFRRADQIKQNKNSETKLITFGDIEIDEIKAEVTKGNHLINLTAKEYQLLLFLVKHPNQILSKELILDRVWGKGYEGHENALMVHMHHLRQKLENEPSLPKYFLTQRGLGYKFVPGEKS